MNNSLPCCKQLLIKLNPLCSLNHTHHLLHVGGLLHLPPEVVVIIDDLRLLSAGERAPLPPHMPLINIINFHDFLLDANLQD